MTITVEHQSPKYDPTAPARRYVRFDRIDDVFRWCVVDQRDRRFNAQSGTCEESDLTPTIAQAARDRSGIWPSFVDWPF